MKNKKFDPKTWREDGWKKITIQIICEARPGKDLVITKPEAEKVISYEFVDAKEFFLKKETR